MAERPAPRLESKPQVRASPQREPRGLQEPRAGTRLHPIRRSSECRVWLRDRHAPFPGTFAMSIPCSSAIFRTTGVERVRNLSSALWPPADGAATVATGGGAGASAVGIVAAGTAASGTAAAAGAPAPGAAPSGSMNATIVPTSTVSPSATEISTSVPDAGDGISASTLSVDISKMGSSRSTVSPSCLSHFETVPSAIDSPIWGIGTSMRATLDHSTLSCLGSDASVTLGVTLRSLLLFKNQ